jgi:galactokinase
VQRTSASWWAPGRVNLIGEHTDYNEGFALPFAIEQGCTATVELTGDDEIVVTSAQRGEAVVAPLTALSATDSDWAGYLLGVPWVLQRRGIDVPGLRIAIDSSVPDGAGLASSAALICAAATAIDDLLELSLQADELLAITRSVENDFVGAPTGGLDQLTVLRSSVGHALLCDFRGLAVRPVPLDPDALGLALLVIDTRTHHQHATGEYALRRSACEQAARQLGVPALRDIDPAGLDDALDRLGDDTLRVYVRHVVTENERVRTTVERLDRGEVAEIGPLLTASHGSLRDDFRVSVAELDVAVDAALEAGAYGARMTGGGFGGSVIALIDADEIDDCRHGVSAAFGTRRFSPPEVFVARAAPGAHRIG